ncbi:hypothetical protein [Allochromatium humboldtianum]|uniref:hypothetical protein n=1 Tax=Allochromatium humboldtianum TaxID=504901 RepID=UPI003CCD8EE3
MFKPHFAKIIQRASRARVGASNEAASDMTDPMRFPRARGCEIGSVLPISRDPATPARSPPSDALFSGG